ncbi:MAG: sigma-70 family RNA polymerase sigma factor [Propionibacteriaceae bacterium]|jgi:RNA polymerase sigma factor (sigma-70 family)|nr:sigma-70 family RNA polymerase sigma factor [Propionibacteriaceae bacterium]
MTTTLALPRSPAPPRLTDADEIDLAQQIEVGLAAEALLEHGSGGPVSGLSAGQVDRWLSWGRPDEWQALVSRGQQAKEKMVVSNLGLVHVIVADFAQRTWVSRSDLFQEGCLALDQAVMRYDWRRGRLGVFAGRWIRNSLHHVAFPVRREITVGLQLEPVSTLDAIADPVIDASDDTRRDLVRLLKRLPQGERKVVSLRHGWSDGQPATLDQIAHRLDLSISKVRRLERQAVARLRQDWLEMAA